MSLQNELERTWKEVAVAQLRFHPCIYLEGMRKTIKASVRMASLPAEKREEYLLNASLGH
jgi:hypothetical protein